MNVTACLPETTTCEMYDWKSNCYPCPCPRFGPGCKQFWGEIRPVHYLIAHIIYGLVGLFFGIAFAQRVWFSYHSFPQSKTTKVRFSFSDPKQWRFVDKIWLSYSAAAFFLVFEFLTRSLYGEYSKPLEIVPNLMSISITLIMVQNIISTVVQWVAIMEVKGRGVTKSYNLLLLQKIFTVQLWSITLLGTFMEQISVPPINGSQSQNIPVALRGGSLTDFRGSFNSRWGLVKNMNHTLIALVFTIVGVVAGLRIVSKLKVSKDTKTKQLIRTIMRYLYWLIVGVTIELVFTIYFSWEDLQNEYYFRKPPCDLGDIYIHYVSLIHILIFGVVFWITKGSVRGSGIRSGSLSSCNCCGGSGSGSDSGGTASRIEGVGNSGSRSSSSRRSTKKDRAKSADSTELTEMVDVDIDPGTTDAENERKQRSFFVKDSKARCTW